MLFVTQIIWLYESSTAAVDSRTDVLDMAALQRVYAHVVALLKLWGFGMRTDIMRGSWQCGKLKVPFLFLCHLLAVELNLHADLSEEDTCKYLIEKGLYDQAAVLVQAQVLHMNAFSLNKNVWFFLCINKTHLNCCPWCQGQALRLDSSEDGGDPLAWLLQDLAAKCVHLTLSGEEYDICTIPQQSMRTTAHHLCILPSGGTTTRVGCGTICRSPTPPMGRKKWRTIPLVIWRGRFFNPI